MPKCVGTFACSLLLLLFSLPVLAVSTTDLNAITPQQLAQLLAGPGVTVSNVTFTGAKVAGGSFTGGLADGIGIDSGVILSSGSVANAVGPNEDDQVTTINETPGDANLDAIVGKGHTTFDAAVLEFDFVPSSNTVSFRYVFASDEYNEFVGQFNDVFAFFIDGQNVALIPGTSTPVAINTVNLETNFSFYRNNDPSDLGIPTPFGTQFDGFTTVLTATATLTPNVSHHIKLAIADTDDPVLDSAVFLQAASFVSQNLTIGKSAPSTVAPGENLTYTITYGNSGNASATNVVIRDPLPAGTSFVSATNGGTLMSGSVVNWNIGTLGAGVTGQTVSFTVHVDATSGTITNANYTIEGTNVPSAAGPTVSTTIGGGGCPTITLLPTTLPNGAVQSPYNQSITASGGSGTYAFSVTSGTLPPGLFLSSGGALSGTPTAAGSYSFTVRAIDSNECTGSRSYTISISGCGGIIVSPAVMFDGFVGEPYRRTISAAGGASPYAFSVTSGSPPPGLRLSSLGVLSGTPIAEGSYTFTVAAVDANGCVGSRTYTVTVICPALLLSPATLPSASAGVAYNQALSVQGGQGPYLFSTTVGLPNGLSLSPSGVLAGSPGEVGTFSFTVTVTDANGCTGVRNYTLAVCVAVITVSPAALPGAVVGSPYNQSIDATGGTPPYAFAQTGLPSPMTLSPSGILSGTPNAAGIFTVTVTATDANGCSGVRVYTLNVCPAIVLSPSTLPGGAVGAAYSQTITASGGTAPYQFAATGLPASLVISGATGVLSGTPTAAGNVDVTVTATDANGCAASRTYRIVVTDAPPVISGLTLSPAAPGTFTLSIAGSGFVDGAMVSVNGVVYPTTFVSPNLVTVTLPASAIPTNGALTAIVTNPGTSGGASNPATLTFCDPPEAPLDPAIESSGNPTGPLTATDFLLVRWQAPAGGPLPSAYEFRINGDPYTIVVGGTSAVVAPRGSNDPITLYVRAMCNANVAGPEVASATYSLAPPVADFTFSAAVVGSPVNFTDTSSPQATSWLWIFDDGGTSTVQSPAHTFTTAGTHHVALIASNGSGSSQRIKDVPVSASGAAGGTGASVLRSFEASDAERWRLPRVSLSAGEPAPLEITSEASEEIVLYLRFLDADGRGVLERRLSVAPDATAVNDVGAYGLEGLYTLEIVSDRRIVAVLAQPFDLPDKARKGNR